jgi:hypothetical protein
MAGLPAGHRALAHQQWLEWLAPADARITREPARSCQKLEDLRILRANPDSARVLQIFGDPALAGR